MADNEVFSTDWSFEGGQNKCGGDDGTDSLRTQTDTAERLPAGLEQRDAALALGAQAADQLVAGGGVRMQPAALGRSVDARAGTGVALVGQAGQAQQGRGGVQCAEKAGGAGGGEVVGRAGFDVARPRPESRSGRR